MKYSSAFYDQHTDVSRKSARRIVPIVLGLLPVASVVDVGCGRGSWLAAFGARGVAVLRGYDGDYVERSTLAIKPAEFEAADLRRPVVSDRRYDLAVSLEVAEHLPAIAADTFISSLCALSDTVLFSAAIPKQGGTGHVNEQWPGYWSRKFRRLGYRAYDVVRLKVWEDLAVAWWFAQNAILYSRKPIAGVEPCADEPLALVHPLLHEFEPTLRMRLGAIKARALESLRG